MTVEEANKIFMSPNLQPGSFREIAERADLALNYHIKQCMAPCTGRVRLKDYNENLNRALEFLRGGSTNSIKS